MERQNVTLSLPRELVKQARHLAVEKGTSLSGLLSRYLEQLVATETAREQANNRLKARLQTGLNLGTEGNRPCAREQMHER